MLSLHHSRAVTVLVCLCFVAVALTATGGAVGNHSLGEGSYSQLGELQQGGIEADVL
jgi:hypothetical protein